MNEILKFNYKDIDKLDVPYSIIVEYDSPPIIELHLSDKYKQQLVLINEV